MHRLPAITVWYAYEAAASFLWALPFTVTAYYFVTEVGMSPLQLVLVGTVMELSVFVFEVPTGVVADTVSRRLSIVVGNVVMGLAFVVVGAFAEVWPILVGYAIWGLGWTFTSGAMDAWLADEVGEERLTDVYLRGAQVSRAFTVLGMLSSVGLALVDLRLPIVLGGIGTIALAAFYTGWMPETGFRPVAREQRGSLGHMVGTARAGAGLVRSRPALLAILGVAAFVGMWTESYDRLWQAHLVDDVGLPSIWGLDPVVWFGILGVVGTLLSIVVAAPVGRRLQHASVGRVARTLTWLYASLALSSFVFALAGSLWLAVLGSYGIFVARQVSAPLFAAWLNRSVDDSTVRATALSIVNQADAVGQWTGGPAIGALGTVTSIRVALVAATACLLPAVGFLRAAARHDEPEPARVPAPSGGSEW
jgi:DHA3 family tetracycline resistance protein-like MFS transporter